MMNSYYAKVLFRGEEIISASGRPRDMPLKVKYTKVVITFT